MRPTEELLAAARAALAAEAVVAALIFAIAVVWLQIGSA